MTRRSATPVVFQALRAGLRMFTGVVVVLLLLFFASGVHYVQPGRVGLQLRFGKLIEIHDEGLVLALPYPIDRVIDTPGPAQEIEVRIDEVYRPLGAGGQIDTIDPLEEGYVLSGDQNVIQVQVVARYRVTDPAAYALATSSPAEAADAPLAERLDHRERILRNVVVAALAQTVAGWQVDDVLRQQRGAENAATAVRQRAQARLTELDCGMELSAVELTRVHPPRHVIDEFNAVRSTETNIQTALERARGEAFSELSQARADREGAVRQAEAYGSDLLARAAAEKSVFESLVGEYQKSPAFVRQRVFLETVEDVFQRVGRKVFLVPGARVLLSDLEARP